MAGPLASQKRSWNLLLILRLHWRPAGSDTCIDGTIAERWTTIISILHTRKPRLRTFKYSSSPVQEEAGLQSDVTAHVLTTEQRALLIQKTSAVGGDIGRISYQYFMEVLKSQTKELPLETLGNKEPS